MRANRVNNCSCPVYQLR